MVIVANGGSGVDLDEKPNADDVDLVESVEKILDKLGPYIPSPDAEVFAHE